MTVDPPIPPEDEGARAPADDVDRRVDSSALFDGADIVYIEHNGQTYILRKTRQGRLILTK